MPVSSVLAFLAASVAAVAAPAWLDLPPYVVHILTLSCLYAIPAIGLNLMLGYPESWSLPVHGNPW